MKSGGTLLVALAFVQFPIAVRAQDFSTGLAAAEVGDFETALGVWRPLADLGDAQAQIGLGLMYVRGEGVPQDFSEAVHWFRLASEQGDGFAQINLGLRYEKGEGVLQDNETAHMWYNLASANGYRDAADLRDLLAENMTPAAVEAAQKRARICMDSGYNDCD